MTHILKKNFDSSFSQFLIYGDAHIYESYMSLLSGVVDTLEPGIHNTGMMSGHKPTCQMFRI